MSSLRLVEQGSAPSDSPSGEVQIYAKTDGKLYTKRGTNSESIVATTGLVGKVLQVKQTVWDRHIVHGPMGGSWTWTEIDTAYRLSITPASTASKILLFYEINFSIAAATTVVFRIGRIIGGSQDTTINLGNATGAPRTPYALASFRGSQTHGAGHWTEMCTHSFLDSPSTASEITYMCQFVPYDSGRTTHFNNTVGDSGLYDDVIVTSTITGIEIGA
jgi:hypothetical protein